MGTASVRRPGSGDAASMAHADADAAAGASRSPRAAGRKRGRVVAAAPSRLFARWWRLSLVVARTFLTAARGGRGVGRVRDLGGGGRVEVRRDPLAARAPDRATGMKGKAPTRLLEVPRRTEGHSAGYRSTGEHGATASYAERRCRAPLQGAPCCAERHSSRRRPAARVFFSQQWDRSGIALGPQYRAASSTATGAGSFRVHRREALVAPFYLAIGKALT